MRTPKLRVNTEFLTAQAYDSRKKRRSEEAKKLIQRLPIRLNLGFYKLCHEFRFVLGP